jgi:hypothetical protein
MKRRTVEERRESERPPEGIRAGICSFCGADAVREFTFQPGRGYLFRIRCWESFGDEPACDWKRVI